ncbi:hypothetical protein C1H46_030155 [Malus baccata]|uniref:Uncharacterized protein n=1 Tax=Malus baccata TaxID=106549 RepID=A0A540LD58_MALBA|nr:hypothetical protein C1H46_030155 [Malus baccata]
MTTLFLFLQCFHNHIHFKLESSCRSSAIHVTLLNTQRKTPTDSAILHTPMYLQETDYKFRNHKKYNKTARKPHQECRAEISPEKIPYHKADTTENKETDNLLNLQELSTPEKGTRSNGKYRTQRANLRTLLRRKK